MRPETIGIIVGGIIPAFLYGVSGLFVKLTNQAGIGVGIYLLIVGVVVSIIGVLLLLFLPTTRALPPGSAMPAVIFGLLWGGGTACIALSISRYGMSISKIVPIFNLNSIIAVGLALWLLAEWKEVRVVQLVAGTLLAVTGAILVARA